MSVVIFLFFVFGVSQVVISGFVNMVLMVIGVCFGFCVFLFFVVGVVLGK